MNWREVAIAAHDAQVAQEQNAREISAANTRNKFLAECKELLASIGIYDFEPNNVRKLKTFHYSMHGAGEGPGHLAQNIYGSEQLYVLDQHFAIEFFSDYGSKNWLQMRGVPRCPYCGATHGGQYESLGITSQVTLGYVLAQRYNCKNSNSGAEFDTLGNFYGKRYNESRIENMHDQGIDYVAWEPWKPGKPEDTATSPDVAS